MKPSKDSSAQVAATAPSQVELLAIDLKKFVEAQPKPSWSQFPRRQGSCGVSTIRALLLRRRVPLVKLGRRVSFVSFLASVPRRVRPNREEGHEQVKTEVQA